MDTANRIQFLRKSRNMSQEELGDKMFVSRQTVSQWETGQTMPSIESLIKLHEIFDVSVDEILGIASYENEEIESKEIDIIERYSFQYDAAEVEKVCSYRTRPLKKYLLLSWIFAVGCFIIMCAAGNISFGILFGIFMGYIIIYSKMLSKAKKEIERTIDRIPGMTYSYAFSQGVLTIGISENGRFISEEHRCMEEIETITDIEGYYILTILGRSYIIRKSDLPNASKMLQYLRSSNSVTSIAPQKIRRWKAISIVAVIASLLSLFGGQSIAVSIAEASGDRTVFLQNMWVLFLFLPIPIFSVVLGCILKRKGIKYKKNIVIGIIMCCLLCIYGSFSFLFSGMNDAIAVVREEMNIDIPEYTSCNMTTNVYPQNRETMKKVSRCDVSFPFDSTVAFYNSIDQNWLTEFPGELREYVAADEADYRADFCLLYNCDTKEYNTVPPEDGEYNMILLLFSKSTGWLYVFQYRLLT